MSLDNWGPQTEPWTYRYFHGVRAQDDSQHPRRNFRQNCLVSRFSSHSFDVQGTVDVNLPIRLGKYIADLTKPFKFPEVLTSSGSSDIIISLLGSTPGPQESPGYSSDVGPAVRPQSTPQLFASEMSQM